MREDTREPGTELPLFQSFWMGASLSPYEHMCLTSFLDHGHDVDLYTYTAELLVPPGVRVLNASEILPKSAYFESPSPSGRPSPSAFSDLFRWTLLSQKGGWWVDTDVVCLKREIPDFELFFSEEEPGIVSTSVLFAPAGHDLTRQCAEEAARTAKPVPWGNIGPALITDRVGALGLAAQSKPNRLCFPTHWTEALDVLLPEKTPALQRQTTESLFIHLWNQVLVMNGIDKNGGPPAGSFLRSVADRHYMDGWNTELPVNDIQLKAARWMARHKPS